MRPRWPTAALAVAAVLAVPACGAEGEVATTLPAAAEPVAAPAPAFEPPARLCDAIPDEVVAETTGRSTVTVDGAGTQCSWRTPSPDHQGTDVVLQGSFIDARSFEVGRSGAVATTEVPGLGEDAYLVREGELAPTTIYVRDGSVAFALWLADPSAPEPEGVLAHLAREVLSS